MTEVVAPLAVQGLTVFYGKKPILWSVDFALRPQTITGIIGPNGAGKSTLLKATLGLIDTVRGSIRFFGGSLAANRKRIAYVPQREQVDWDFPASALDVVLMGRWAHIGWFRHPTKEDIAKAERALTELGIEALADRQISELSGGQQQRVFIARALAQEGDIFILDEPFAGVDATTEDIIFQILLKLKNEGKSVVLVHHDLQSAQRYFDDILMLNTQLVAFGSCSSVFTEENLRKTYGGKLAILDRASIALER